MHEFWKINLQTKYYVLIVNKDGGLSSIEDEELAKSQQPDDKPKETEPTPPGAEPLPPGSEPPPPGSEPLPPGAEPAPPGVSQEDLISPKKEKKVKDSEIKIATEVINPFFNHIRSWIFVFPPRLVLVALV